MSSRLAATTSRSERADANLAERTTFAERVATAYERGEVLSIDIAQDPYNLSMFTRYAEQYGGTSSAARTMMEAELARQSPKPNRVFSDATGIPSSFEEVRTRHNEAAVDPALERNVSTPHEQNQNKVMQFEGAVQVKRDAPQPASDMRSAVRDQGARVRSATAGEEEAFDRNAQVTHRPDGTLSSKRSLMKQTGKQVKEDATGMIDDARQAVKDALRKE
jgi:conjugal transfer mating pair stabilization protein TraG